MSIDAETLWAVPSFGIHPLVIPGSGVAFRFAAVFLTAEAIRIVVGTVAENGLRPAPVAGLTVS